jgi:hypothetical protein
LSHPQSEKAIQGEWPVRAVPSLTFSLAYLPQVEVQEKEKEKEKGHCLTH